MQQLNAAWHVLSDPARRRRYDQSLDAVSADDCPVEPATDDPPEYVSEPTGRGRGLPVVALLSVVLVSAVVGAFVLFHETSSHPGNMEAVTAGTCVTVRGGHIREVVPCDSPNDGRVLAEIPRGQSCATPTDRLVDGRLGGSTVVCLDTTGRP